MARLDPALARLATDYLYFAADEPDFGVSDAVSLLLLSAGVSYGPPGFRSEMRAYHLTAALATCRALSLDPPRLLHDRGVELPEGLSVEEQVRRATRVLTTSEEIEAMRRDGKVSLHFEIREGAMGIPRALDSHITGVIFGLELEEIGKWYEREREHALLGIREIDRAIASLIGWRPSRDGVSFTELRAAFGFPDPRPILDRYPP